MQVMWAPDRCWCSLWVPLVGCQPHDSHELQGIAAPHEKAPISGRIVTFHVQVTPPLSTHTTFRGLQLHMKRVLEVTATGAPCTTGVRGSTEAQPN